jgi:hypothetical protein
VFASSSGEWAIASEFFKSGSGFRAHNVKSKKQKKSTICLHTKSALDAWQLQQKQKHTGSDSRMEWNGV